MGAQRPQTFSRERHPSRIWLVPVVEAHVDALSVAVPTGHNPPIRKLDKKGFASKWLLNASVELEKPKLLSEAGKKRGPARVADYGGRSPRRGGPAGPTGRSGPGRRGTGLRDAHGRAGSRRRGSVAGATGRSGAGRGGTGGPGTGRRDATGGCGRRPSGPRGSRGPTRGAGGRPGTGPIAGTGRPSRAGPGRGLGTHPTSVGTRRGADGSPTRRPAGPRRGGPDVTAGGYP